MGNEHEKAEQAKWEALKAWSKPALLLLILLGGGTFAVDKWVYEFIPGENTPSSLNECPRLDQWVDVNTNLAVCKFQIADLERQLEPCKVE